MLEFAVKILLPVGETGNYLMPSFINTGICTFVKTVCGNNYSEELKSSEDLSLQPEVCLVKYASYIVAIQQWNQRGNHLKDCDVISYRLHYLEFAFLGLDIVVQTWVKD